jgi:hypothetical protein
MAALNKPFKPLTLEEIAKILVDLSNYQQEEMECIINMAFAEKIKDMQHWSLKRIMILERVSTLKIKLLKGCDCGRSHIEYIESEERIKSIYTERLLNYGTKSL